MSGHGGNVWQGDGPEKWMDFSANLRPEGTPAWVTRALESAVSQARYYPDLAMKKARQGIAAYAGVLPECVLPTAGEMSAIDLALRGEKGSVRCLKPTFSEYAARAMANGRAALDSTEDCEAGDTVVLCNPNNPTGSTLQPEQILSLWERVDRRGAQLVVDEAFIDYCPECSVRAFVRRGLCVVGSLTKILCIPGVRLGYVCADRETILELQKIALPWEISAFAAAVAGELPKHLDAIRAYGRENALRRERFAERLLALGIKVQHSRANFLLCDFGRDTRKLTEILKTRGILVRECRSFGLPESFLRLAVRTQEENELLTGELEKWLKY